VKPIPRDIRKASQWPLKAHIGSVSFLRRGFRGSDHPIFKAQSSKLKAPQVASISLLRLPRPHTAAAVGVEVFVDGRDDLGAATISETVEGVMGFAFFRDNDGLEEIGLGVDRFTATRSGIVPPPIFIVTIG
jgi:hypothetical protein